jgi:hypothetical protein
VYRRWQHRPLLYWQHLKKVDKQNSDNIPGPISFCESVRSQERKYGGKAWHYQREDIPIHGPASGGLMIF